VEIIPIGSPRRNLISWSAEARALFTEIAGEVDGQPGVRVGLALKRPVIFINRQIAAAGFEDGIAVRLSPQDKTQALQIFGCRELRRRDHLAMRGMVAVPWSAHEHWRAFIHAAVAPAAGIAPPTG
jgi:hypothetical protein